MEASVCTCDEALVGPSRIHSRFRPWIIKARSKAKNCRLEPSGSIMLVLTDLNI